MRTERLDRAIVGAAALLIAFSGPASAHQQTYNTIYNSSGRVVGYYSYYDCGNDGVAHVCSTGMTDGRWDLTDYGGDSYGSRIQIQAYSGGRWVTVVNNYVRDGYKFAGQYELWEDAKFRIRGCVTYSTGTNRYCNTWLYGTNQH